ncbi:hypothetical protein [Flavimaricola marinus]|uniref:Curlin minor subunit CsgB n=1 Tax=Flavimaricola marinus TaxID=1819565 RepID=A0A238LGW6_9RHOB|nr:hypothetical protein [Flavimaricola marinus]SMY08783.1 curlin minor subunit CsgB [Flavimaricola marinus]
MSAPCWPALAVALSLSPGVSAGMARAETVTVVPGSVTMQMTPQEFRAHRVDRGTALTAADMQQPPSAGVRVLQNGDHNTATVATQPGNAAMVIQQGDGHAATVTQEATGQGALVIQTGTGGATDLTQTTQGEKVVIVQHSWQPRR